MPTWLLVMIAILVLLAILWLVGIRFGTEDAGAAMVAPLLVKLDQYGNRDS